MDKSESVKEIAMALNKLQKVLSPVKKDAVNPYFKSKYATLDTIWEMLRKPLTDNGLSVTQTLHKIEETTYLETTLLHTSGEWISGAMPLNPTKDDPQGLGSAISYARRYSLSALLGVVSDEDDDGEKATDKPAPQQPKAATPKPPRDAPQPVQEKTNTNPQDADIPGMKTLTDMQKVVYKEFGVQPKKALEIINPDALKWNDVSDTPKECYAIIKQWWKKNEADDVPF